MVNICHKLVAGHVCLNKIMYHKFTANVVVSSEKPKMKHKPEMLRFPDCVHRKTRDQEQKNMASKRLFCVSCSISLY